MEVVLVGTGGDAGWPEPGCRCASCASARAAGQARSPAAVRIDGAAIRDPRGRPGDRLNVGGHIIELHAGAGPGRMAWSVTGPDGSRLLYAPGGIQRESLSAAPAAGPFGLVVLGPGPDGIASIPQALAGQRAVAAVTDQTDVVLTGLGHDDPPPATFDRLLAAWGARTVADGTAVQVRALPSASGRSRPRLSGRTLVLGGARSGKSAYAENLLRAEPTVTYLATGGTRADDAEWRARVAAHRRRRPTGWITVETIDVAAVLAAATHPVLLDCLGTWLTARLDHHDAWGDPRARGAVAADMAELVATWRALTVPVVAVSNEVGSGVVPAAASGRLFRDLLGRLNTDIAAQSETVLLTVAGLTVALRTPA